MSSSISSDTSDSENDAKEYRLSRKIKQIKARIKEADGKIKTMKKIADKGEESILERINAVESLQQDIKEKENVLLELQSKNVSGSLKQQALHKSQRNSNAHTNPEQTKEGSTNRPRSPLSDVPTGTSAPPFPGRMRHSASCQNLAEDADLDERVTSLPRGFPSWNDRVKVQMKMLEKLSKTPTEFPPHNKTSFAGTKVTPGLDLHHHRLDQVQTLASKLRHAEEQKASLADRCRQLESENECQRKEVAHLRDSMEQMRTDETSTKKHLEETKIRLREAEISLENTRVENEKLEAKINQKKTKMKELNSRLEALNSELRTAHGGRGSIEGLKREVTALMEERLHLEGRLKAREDEVDEMRKRLQESKDQLKDAVLRVQMLERDLNLLSEDKKNLQKQLLTSSSAPATGNGNGSYAEMPALSWASWSDQDKNVREVVLLRKLLDTERSLKHFKESWKMERRRNERLRRKMASNSTDG